MGPTGSPVSVKGGPSIFEKLPYLLDRWPYIYTCISSTSGTRAQSLFTAWRGRYYQGGQRVNVQSKSGFLNDKALDLLLLGVCVLNAHNFRICADPLP